MSYQLPGQNSHKAGFFLPLNPVPELIEWAWPGSLGCMGIIKRTAWRRWKPVCITHSEHINVCRLHGSSFTRAVWGVGGEEGSRGCSYYRLFINITQSCDCTPWAKRSDISDGFILFPLNRASRRLQTGQSDTTRYGQQRGKRGAIYLFTGFINYKALINKPEGENELKTSDWTSSWIRPQVQHPHIQGVDSRVMTHDSLNRF